MDTVGPMPAPEERQRSWLARRAARVGSLLWRLLGATVRACMRHRVTGLAAEAAFFAILSIPPLIFALAGSIGFVDDWFGEARVGDFRDAVVDLSLRALTPAAVDRIIEPTLDDVLGAPRLDVISVGFVLALWSGSRALNVFIDTITIMHGLGGQRGIIRTRILSFSLYALAMVTGAISIPLLVIGPDLLSEWLPARVEFLTGFYWPVVAIPHLGPGTDQVELQPAGSGVLLPLLDRRFVRPPMGA
jgi:membrane protein